MYSPVQLAAMRADPDRPRLLSAMQAAYAGLPVRTATADEVFARFAAGRVEVLFDGTFTPAGGMTPGETPVVLGGRGLIGRPNASADLLLTLVLSAVHEGVHCLDVEFGRCQPGAAATVEERFFTELHAYTAEYELADANGITHLLAPEFRGTTTLEDMVASLFTVENTLAADVNARPGLEAVVVQRVGGMFPGVPRQAP